METTFDDETNGMVKIRVNDVIFTIFHDVENITIGIDVVGGSDCIDMPDFEQLVDEINRVIKILDA